MEKRPRTFDMPEEFHAQALTLASAFYKTGDVGQYQFVISAQTGFQGREGVVSDLLLGPGQFVHKAGFAGIGQADEADVGYELKLQMHSVCLSPRTLLMLPGTGVG